MLKKKIWLSVYCLWSGFLLSANNIDSLEHVLKTHPENDTIKINLLNQLAAALKQSDAEKAFAHSNHALELSEKLEFNTGIAYAKKILADIFSGRREMKKAMEYYESAIILYRVENDFAGLGSVFIGIGNIHDITGKYDMALSAYFKALENAKKAGHESLIAFAHLGIGNILSGQKRYKEAAEHFHESYIMLVKINNPYKAWALNNLANTYTRVHELDKALEMYLETVRLKRLENDSFGLSIAYTNIGGIYVLKKEYENALKYYHLALRIKRSFSNNEEEIAHTLKEIANTYKLKKDYSSALKNYQEAEQNARKANSAKQTYLTLKGLSETYALMKQYDEAYKKYDDFFTLYDSSYNEEGSKQIAEMNTRYETEKKENQIQILSQENQIQLLNINRQKTFIYSACAGILMLFAIVFLLYRSYGHKKKSHRELEQKNISISRQNSEIQQQKDEIENQKTLIESANEALSDKNKQMTDSILYAKRIQRAFLTSDKYLNQFLPDYFILFKPKDIVSGDFYWGLSKNGRTLLATADCTGHGVPGAFMSMIGIAFLNEIAIEKNILQPDLILNELRENIIKSLNPDEHENYLRYSSLEDEIKDGMDVALCSFDFQNMELLVSASNNPVCIVRNKTELMEIEPDSMPVGKHLGEITPFTLHKIQLQKGDCIYTFSDGYADQFGGKKGKKFKYRMLKELLLSVGALPMQEQKRILNDAIEQWKGTLRQTDDICVIGVRV